ncbi:nucleotide exchange factor GrpE [Synechococcus sp. HK01-R]|uniref:nucleotide exchange factor GrpE n=1 Tax=Synechococcus sp. HK01-R TaxID=2751171 RepID=UPI001629B04A|nr:nucleotide exchange factor GrpE [Synechococcus sp. HK01-R]QNG27688.1 nucleotide exchange factor GrpE [Synechococcus sp. HK01-R]
MSGDLSSPAHESTAGGGSEVPSSSVSPESAAQQPSDSSTDGSAGSMDSPTASETVDGSTESAADNSARLEQLEREHSSLREEHETLRSQYMRIAADFDNFRKRQSRDQDDLKLQLTCSTLSEILPVVDNFERARQQLNPESEEAQSLHRSYQGLYKQLVDVLKQLGVAPMRVVGQDFDPTLHEAVLREPSDEHHEDVVIEELQRGYHLNGRVLRHAMVKVSMGPGPQGGAAARPDADADSSSAETGDSSDASA